MNSVRKVTSVHEINVCSTINVQKSSATIIKLEMVHHVTYLNIPDRIVTSSIQIQRTTYRKSQQKTEKGRLLRNSLHAKCCIHTLHSGSNIEKHPLNLSKPPWASSLFINSVFTTTEVT